MVMVAASTLVVTRNLKGFVAETSMASICSVTRMEPNSAPILEPTFPAAISEVRRGARVLSKAIPTSEGEVKVLGQHVDQISYGELLALRLKVGFSFQNSALYDSMTVRQNLEFPLVRNQRKLTKGEVNQAVERVLDAVGLLQTINQMPSELSGGQRKRVGIARTLILQPEVMLYDEPTAGLDPITCLEINSLINEVQERFHTSSIVITHDLTCAKAVGNRVAMLLDGKFERQGTFDEVFNTSDERVKPFYDYNFIQ
jgi:phospholipid/cholesterol/gamma-HCH transport system ATP-binding protein